MPSYYLFKKSGNSLKISFKLFSITFQLTIFSKLLSALQYNDKLHCLSLELFKKIFAFYICSSFDLTAATAAVLIFIKNFQKYFTKDKNKIANSFNSGESLSTLPPWFRSWPSYPWNKAGCTAFASPQFRK